MADGMAKTDGGVITAAILVIGDEILSGRTKDKNIGYIAEYLTNIGIDLKEVRVVPDEEPEIINAKRVAAQQLLDTVPENGGRFELTEEGANAWITAVNDIRLTLGVMLEIGPQGPERLPADHPLAVHYDVYQWLTVLQEYLVLVLMEPRRS